MLYSLSSNLFNNSFIRYSLGRLTSLNGGSGAFGIKPGISAIFLFSFFTISNTLFNFFGYLWAGWCLGHCGGCTGIK